MNRLLLLAPRIATNRLWALAGEVPSFHIAPARTRDARDLITGSVLGTYNSASPAWAVGPDGVLALPAANAPVIEYDPVTLQCLGARIWGVVTNLFTYSSTFTDASWSKSNLTITANSATSPAGTTDASLVSPLNSGSQVRSLGQNYTTSTAGTYTFSIYVKINTLTSGLLALRMRNSSGTIDCYSSWSTSTFQFGSVIVSGGWTGSTAVQALQNGWFRLSLTVTTTSSSHTALRGELWPGGYAGTPDTIGSPLIYGAQFQAGTLGPYVPTTTLAASSTADVWSITGADAARIINGAQFTVYMDGYRTFTGNFPDYPSFYAISDGSNSNTCPGFGIQGGQAITNSQIISGGIGQTDFVFVNLGGSQSMKIVQALATNDSQFGVNGTLTAADTSVTMPVGLNKISIGSNAASASLGNFYIREFSIFRSRRPNSNLSSIMSS